MATPFSFDANRDGRLVAAARDGDETAFGKLYDIWFDRAYDHAYAVLRDDQGASDAAQDAFLHAWRRLADLDNPKAFGGWLLRIARNTALNSRRKDARLHSVDAEGLTVIEDTARTDSAVAGLEVGDRLGRAQDPVAAAEDAEIASLVWEAADALDERDALVLDLQLRRGLTPGQIAVALGVERNNANQIAHRVRRRLGEAVRAVVLWRDGDPDCPELQAQLDAAGVEAFGGQAVRIAKRHALECERCDARQRTHLEPAALFAATPVVVAPLVLKQNAAHALEQAGVPMSGSTVLNGVPVQSARRHAVPRKTRRHTGRAVGIGVAAAAVVLFGLAVALGVFAGESGEDESAAVSTSTTQTTTTIGALEIRPGDAARESTPPTSSASASASAGRAPAPVFSPAPQACDAGAADCNPAPLPDCGAGEMLLGEGCVPCSENSIECCEAGVDGDLWCGDDNYPQIEQSPSP